MAVTLWRGRKNTEKSSKSFDAGQAALSWGEQEQELGWIHLQQNYCVGLEQNQGETLLVQELVIDKSCLGLTPETTKENPF